MRLRHSPVKSASPGGARDANHAHPGGRAYVQPDLRKKCYSYQKWNLGMLFYCWRLGGAVCRGVLFARLSRHVNFKPLACLGGEGKMQEGELDRATRTAFLQGGGPDVRAVGGG